MELLLPLLAVAVLYSFVSLRVSASTSAAVTFFLGRFWGTKGPGLIFLPAGFAAQKRVSLRIMALDIPPQDVITRDNVSVKVNAVLYMRVTDPAQGDHRDRGLPLRHEPAGADHAALGAGRGRAGRAAGRPREDQRGAQEDHRRADRPLGHRGLRGRGEGRGPARPDEARDGAPGRGGARAAGQGDRGPGRAAGVRRRWPRPPHTLAQEPSAIQLRYLQTVTEIAAENNSTTIFPIPIELFKPFLQAQAAAPASPPAGPSGEPPGAGAARRRSLHPDVPAPPRRGPDAVAGIAWAKARRPAIDRAALERIIQRAAELQTSDRDIADELTPGPGARAGPRGRHPRPLPAAGAARGADPRSSPCSPPAAGSGWPARRRWWPSAWCPGDRGRGRGGARSSGWRRRSSSASSGGSPGGSPGSRWAAWRRRFAARPRRSAAGSAAHDARAGPTPCPPR